MRSKAIVRMRGGNGRAEQIGQKCARRGLQGAASRFVLYARFALLSNPPAAASRRWKVCDAALM